MAGNLLLAIATLSSVVSTINAYICVNCDPPTDENGKLNLTALQLTIYRTNLQTLQLLIFLTSVTVLGLFVLLSYALKYICETYIFEGDKIWNYFRIRQSEADV